MTADRAPVIVFGYNRPGHLGRTLTALARAEGAGETPLWLFCDGPKPGQDPAAVEAVRAIARDPEWTRCFAAVTVVLAEDNKGLARSIIDGVSQVLDEADRVMVLEDDLIVAPDFLRFMNDCLAFYREDPKVGSITGFCPLKSPPPGYAHDVMAVPRNCSHGWATWADRWARVDWEARAAPRLWRDAALRRRFNAAGSDRFERLRRQLAGRIDSWSIRFGLWQLLEGRHTIYPVTNRIQNIGFDGTGVHTRAGQEINSLLVETPQLYRLKRPEEDPAVLRAFQRVYSGSRQGRIRRNVFFWTSRLFRKESI